MALLSIEVNGVMTIMPTPTDMEIEIYDISKAERLANGQMNIERIATKMKLQITYDYITATNLKTVLSAISPTFYNVQFHDPKTNALRTASMYCGDRSIGFIDYQNSTPRYRGVSFDLIER